MKYLKNIIAFFESITSYNKLKSWTITFNHYVSHDLDDKMRRTQLTETDFPKVLEEIIKLCDIDNLDGDWVFISFKYNCKIVTRVLKKINTLYIITFLGKEQFIKKTKNIKII